jgi:hypothetical protein
LLPQFEDIGNMKKFSEGQGLILSPTQSRERKDHHRTLEKETDIKEK